MKPLAIAIFAAAALPLFADEPQKQTATTTTASETTTTAAASPAAATPDSPLVAAAKAAKAKKAAKDKIVITNDNLKKDGGHITTTAKQDPLPPIKPSIAANRLQVENDKRDREEMEKKLAEKKAAEAKAKQNERMSRAQAVVEGETLEGYDDDPNEAERAQQKAAQPTTTSDQKPPM